jgi:ACS family hexuronate transporter-like MFS transporter
MDFRQTSRGPAWKWWVCSLLLMATMINYMDRLTLNQAAKHIKEELELNNRRYGNVESAFSFAFAIGALVMGRLADFANVRWLFPAALLGWSAAGFVTGFAQNYEQLVTCRVMLGIFESGLWPCALRTTQRILPPGERTLGNGILQSGAALGSIITPQIIRVLVVGPGTWPYPFFVVGAAGTGWVFLWLASVRSADIAVPQEKSSADRKDGAKFSWRAAVEREIVWLGQMARQRRFWVLIVLVVAINQTWHFFRAWLPLFLQEHHSYSDSSVQNFTTLYYTCADLGSLTAGFVALRLARSGWQVHASRVIVFGACSLLTLLSFAVAFLETGPLLLGLLMLLAFGSLGVFPVYYSLSQELTVADQGRLTGTLGFTTWMMSVPMHHYVGEWLDATKDWPTALALAGLPPLLGLIVLLLFWGRTTPDSTVPAGLDLARDDESLRPEEHVIASADKVQSR